MSPDVATSVGRGRLGTPAGKFFPHRGLLELLLGHMGLLIWNDFERLHRVMEKCRLKCFLVIVLTFCVLWVFRFFDKGGIEFICLGSQP